MPWLMELVELRYKEMPGFDIANTRLWLEWCLRERAMICGRTDGAAGVAQVASMPWTPSVLQADLMFLASWPGTGGTQGAWRVFSWLNRVRKAHGAAKFYVNPSMIGFRDLGAFVLRSGGAALGTVYVIGD